MVLQFKFTYKNSNHLFLNFLKNTLKEKAFFYKLYKDLDYVYLFLEANEDELIEFSNELSSNLPMSLFYYGVDMKVVEVFPKHKSIDIKKDYKIGFCPSCLKKAIKNFNAFECCSLCDGIKANRFFYERKETSSSNTLFKELALAINEDKKIKIKTISGFFVFSKVNNLDESKELLLTNFKNLSKIFVENKTDVVALASIEKPQIEFRFNEVYKSIKNVKRDKIDIRVANDLVLYLLSIELEKLGIDLLNIEDENCIYDISLDNDSKEEFINYPKVKCFENKKLFIKNEFYNKGLDEVYKKFKDKNKAMFLTLIAQNNLFDDSVINFYFSSLNNDAITLYSQKHEGFVELLKPLEIPKTIKDIFKEIKKDDIGFRLIENYKKKFPKEYEEALVTNISSYNKKSFYTYFKIAKIILGFKNDILKNSDLCMSEKGPRIDYKLQSTNNSYCFEFDVYKLIRSAMSFKIAGVEEELISLGFIESLAHFIAIKMDEYCVEYEIDNISLCGDLFLNEKFNALVEKSLTNNLKIYYNREFIIDL